MPSFSELMNKHSIFKNKEALSPHYVPDHLPYREEEITKIMTSVLPALKNQKPKNMFIYGGVGTGKTASTKKVLQKLENEKRENIKPIYLNCRVYDSRYKILQKALCQLQENFAKTGYSFAVLYEKALDWVEGNADNTAPKHLILALDEVDMVKDLDNLVYTLTRANDDLKKGSVSMIGISNKVDFKRRLDSRSKSSLCEEELVFKPYNSKQLQGILKERIKNAFEKTTMVQASGISLAAAIAASENGDARYALLLLQKAGELAEKKASKITDEEVEQARKAADEDKAFEVISTLPEQQQILLLAIAILSKDTRYKKLVEENGDRFYFSGEVYERYRSIVRRMGKQARTSRWYREYLNDLENLGLINTLHSGKGVRGQTTLIKLSYEPEKVKKVIEKTLLEFKE
ncbi:MAG: Cdc6/Cdc18 family protein [Candidatus Micrarchaeia archaeon]